MRKVEERVRNGGGGPKSSLENTNRGYEFFAILSSPISKSFSFFANVQVSPTFFVMYHHKKEYEKQKTRYDPPSPTSTLDLVSRVEYCRTENHPLSPQTPPPPQKNTPIKEKNNPPHHTYHTTSPPPPLLHIKLKDNPWVEREREREFRGFSFSFIYDRYISVEWDTRERGGIK